MRHAPVESVVQPLGIQSVPLRRDGTPEGVPDARRTQAGPGAGHDTDASVESDLAAANRGSAERGALQEPGQLSATKPRDAARGAALARARHLSEAYKANTQVVLDSVDASGMVEMVDGWGVTGRLRPNDAASAILRANASLFSVQRDIERGSASPRDFGVQRWDEVTPERMMAIARSRLAAGGSSAHAAIRDYLASPGYRRAPLQVTRAGARVTLTEEPGFSGERGVGHWLFPARYAAAVSDGGVMRTAEKSAIATASAKAGPEDGRLQVALSLWRGAEAPRDASQALVTMAAAAQVPFAQRAPQDFARDLHARAMDPAAPLSAETRAAIREIAGPDDAPGRELAQRIASEENSRSWRAIGGEVVVVAGLTAGTFLTGGLAGALAAGLDASAFTIAVTNVATQTLAFAGASQVRQGELRPADFARDLALFGPMAGGQYLARMAAGLSRGTTTAAGLQRAAIIHGVAGITATGTMVGVDMGERILGGQSVNDASLRESIQRNALMTGAAMTVGGVLTKAFPRLNPDALAAAANAPRVPRVDGPSAPAVAQPPTTPPLTLVQELRADGVRYSVRDDLSVVSDTGQSLKVRIGAGMSFVAEDSQGGLVLFEARPSGDARVRRASGTTFDSTNDVGVLDGVPVTRTASNVLIDEHSNPVAVRAASPDAAAIRVGGDGIKTLFAGPRVEPLVPVVLPDGRTIYRSRTHMISAEGGVYRPFGQDGSGRQVVVDHRGAGLFVEPNGVYRPVTASTAADGFRTDFRPVSTVTHPPLVDVGAIRADIGLPTSPPSSPAYLDRAGASTSRMDLRLRDGRVVRVDRRGDRDVAFDVDGRPQEILPGPGVMPDQIVGMTGATFLVREDAGRARFFESVLSLDGAAIVRVEDGTHAILRRSSGTPMRTGVIASGTGLTRHVDHMVIDGDLYTPRGSVQGRPELVYAASGNRDGVFRIQGAGDSARPVPAKPKGIVAVLDDAGARQRIYHDGRALAVVGEPGNHWSPDIMPFVLAVESEPLPGPRSAPSAWPGGLSFEPERFAVYVDRGNSLRPASLGEVRAVVDRLVSHRGGVAWQDLPRPTSVTIEGAGMAKRVLIRRDSETLDIPMGERPTGADPALYPTDAQITQWFQKLPMQSFRGLERVELGNVGRGLAAYVDETRTMYFGPNQNGWRGPLHDVFAGHEITGHHIERGSPELARLMMLTGVLDRAHGSSHAARVYGTLDPREYFATMIERYVGGDRTMAARWPHFDRLMGALFTPDGRSASPTLFRNAASAMLPIALLSVMARENSDDSNRS